MPSEKSKQPEKLEDGRIPTFNNRGFSADVLDPISEAFVEFSKTANQEVLDIGCAFGVASKRALTEGAKVCASDMDQRHLDYLSDTIEDDQRSRLRCVAGELPGMEFESNSFSAILCARLLHFLKGDEIEHSMEKFRDWLIPGGKLFVVVDTPYAGILRSNAADYERRKSQNDPWPGFIPDQSVLLPEGISYVYDPKHINRMDPDILKRVCVEAGFTVESCAFYRRVAKLADADPQGRDHAGLVAINPGK